MKQILNSKPCCHWQAPRGTCLEVETCLCQKIPTHTLTIFRMEFQPLKAHSQEFSTCPLATGLAMHSPRDPLCFYLPHQTSLTVKTSGLPCFGLLFPSDRLGWLSSGSPRFTTSLWSRDHTPCSPHGFAHPGTSQDVSFGGQGPCAFPSTLLMPMPDPGVRVALSECLWEEGPVSYFSLSLNMLPNDTSPLK